MVALLLDDEGGRTTVTRLAARLSLTQPTVSHHAKALFDGGLLRRDPDGRQVWYSVSPEYVDQATDLFRDTNPSTADPLRPDSLRSGPLRSDVLDRVVADLAERFHGTFGRETVERYVHESHLLLADRSGLARSVLSLSAQFAADRLSALARTARPATGIPEVLFVCVQNAGRSQIAAAILRQIAGDRVNVRTAGSEPAVAVRSVVIAALDEIGVPLGGEYPKPLTDEVVRAADVVVTMGCGDACPVYPGRRYLDWNLDDPVGLPLARVRDIRDEIETRVRDLVATL